MQYTNNPVKYKIYIFSEDFFKESLNNAYSTNQRNMATGLNPENERGFEKEENEP